MSLVPDKLFFPFHRMARKTPLAMITYQYLFNSCRFPRKDVDTTEKFDSRVNNHMIIMRRNKFYELQVIDDSGVFLSEADLRAQLERIVEMAGDVDDPHPLGALTLANRDLWAEAQEELLRAAPQNKELLEKLASGIMVLTLDSVLPITREQVTLNWWVGQKSGNRYFDKHQSESG